MLEKSIKGLKWFAVLLLVLLTLQTALLLSIWQELVNIRVETDVLVDTLRLIARNQP